MSMKKYDIFSNIFGFTYDRSVRFQTNLGSIISVLFIVIYFTVMFSFGYEFFDKHSNVIINSLQIKYSSPPSISFKHYCNSSIIFLLIIDGEVINLDKHKEDFDLSFYYVNLNNKNNSYIETKINLESCKNSPINLDYKQCLYHDSMTYPIEGGDVSLTNFQKSNSSFSFYIAQLKYKSNSKNALRLLNYHSVTAQIIYTDVTYDPMNYDFPINDMVNIYDTQLNILNKKHINMFYEYTKFSSEDYNLGLYSITRNLERLEVIITENGSNPLDQKFSILSKNRTISNLDNDVLANLYIRSGNKAHIITRKFPKLSQIVSNIAGFMTFIYYLFSLISYIYSETAFFTKLTKDSIFLIKNSDLARNIGNLRHDDNLSKTLRNNRPEDEIASKKPHQDMSNFSIFHNKIKIRKMFSDINTPHSNEDVVKKEESKPHMILNFKNPDESDLDSNLDSYIKNEIKDTVSTIKSNVDTILSDKQKVDKYVENIKNLELAPNVNEFSHMSNPIPIREINSNKIIPEELHSCKEKRRNACANNLLMNQKKPKIFNRNYLNSNKIPFTRMLNKNEKIDHSENMNMNSFITPGEKNFTYNNFFNNDINQFNKDKEDISHVVEIEMCDQSKQNLCNNILLSGKEYMINPLNKKSTKSISLNYLKTNHSKKPERNLNEEINSFYILRFLKFDLNSSLAAICCISFFPCFRSCNKKIKHQYNIYQFSKNYFEKYLDFNNFMQKFIEVDMIKNFIFNKEQLFLIKQLKNIIILDNNHENLKVVGNEVDDSIIYQFGSGKKDKDKYADINMISNNLQKFYLNLSQNKERNLIEDNFFNYLHKLSNPFE